MKNFSSHKSKAAFPKTEVLGKPLLVWLFVPALFVVVLAAGCKTPAGSEGPYTLHFTPGTYEAGATGYNQTTPIRVRVTFSEDAIEAVEIVSHEETVSNEKVQATLELIPEAIVEEQTLALDAVSGATARWTKEGILKAVEDCVKQAGGGEAAAKLKEGRVVLRFAADGGFAAGNKT
jgi:fumarate reductase flavoprotein subunit